MMILPSEIETTITAEQGRIWIEQKIEDGSIQIIELTVHQFIAIINKEQMIVRKALGTIDEL